MAAQKKDNVKAPSGLKNPKSNLQPAFNAPKRVAKKKSKKKKRPVGRPNISQKNLVDFLFLYGSTSMSMNSVANKLGIGVRTIWNHIQKNDEFRRKYEDTRKNKVEVLIEEILDVADDGTNDWMTNKQGEDIINHEVVQRSRLRVDARKWLASKFVPKMYGEKLHTEHSGKIKFNDNSVEAMSQEERKKEIDRMISLRQLHPDATSQN